jgi:hypothetical protein
MLAIQKKQKKSKTIHHIKSNQNPATHRTNLHSPQNSHFPLIFSVRRNQKEIYFKKESDLQINKKRQSITT